MIKDDMETNLDLQTSSGWTALICACFNDNTEIALALIYKGVNLDTQDIYGILL